MYTAKELFKEEAIIYTSLHMLTAKCKDEEKAHARLREKESTMVK